MLNTQLVESSSGQKRLAGPPNGSEYKLPLKHLTAVLPVITLHLLLFYHRNKSSFWLVKAGTNLE